MFSWDLFREKTHSCIKKCDNFCHTLGVFSLGSFHLIQIPPEDMVHLIFNLFIKHYLCYEKCYYWVHQVFYIAFSLWAKSLVTDIVFFPQSSAISVLIFPNYSVTAALEVLDYQIFCTCLDCWKFLEYFKKVLMYLKHFSYICYYSSL